MMGDGNEEPGSFGRKVLYPLRRPAASRLDSMAQSRRERVMGLEPTTTSLTIPTPMPQKSLRTTMFHSESYESIGNASTTKRHAETHGDQRAEWFRRSGFRMGSRTGRVSLRGCRAARTATHAICSAASAEFGTLLAKLADRKFAKGRASISCSENGVAVKDDKEVIEWITALVENLAGK